MTNLSRKIKKLTLPKRNQLPKKLPLKRPKIRSQRERDHKIKKHQKVYWIRRVRPRKIRTQL